MTKQQPIRSAVFALLCSIPLAGLAAPAARVMFATPGASTVKADGTQRPLHKGDALVQGDTVATRGGRAQLQFSDGAFVSLQPDTLFRIDEYRFEGKADGSERGFFSLLKGGLRTITGLVGRTHKANYQVTTQVATIGIRGTEYQLQYGNSVSGSVGEGEIRVCNGGGCLGVASGQSFFVANPNDLPVLTAVRTSFAPPQPQVLMRQLPGGVDPEEQLGNATGAIELREAVPFPVQGEDDTGSAFPPVGQLVSGGNYALAYARDAGGDSPGLGKKTGTAQFNAQDQLLSYRSPGQLDLQRRNIAESGADSLIGWGRWTQAYVDADETVELLDQQGLHYIVGRATPAPELNNGTASYNLLGATIPTGTDNMPGGKLDRATLWLNFGTKSVDLDMQVTYGGRAYTVDTRGSEGSGVQLNRGQATFAGQGLATSCPSNNCATDVAGIVAGPQAERAGMTYSITDRMSPNYDGISPKASALETPALRINGAAAFTRSASPTPSFQRN